MSDVLKIIDDEWEYAHVHTRFAVKRNFGEIWWLLMSQQFYCPLMLSFVVGMNSQKMSVKSWHIVKFQVAIAEPTQRAI